MIARKIFQRKKSKTKFIIITSALLFIIMTVYYFLLDNRDEFVILPENKKPFYIIPEDRGGQKVENLDKKRDRVLRVLDGGFGSDRFCVMRDGPPQ